MRCPYCKDPAGSKVIDSRETGDGCVIRRRRECLHCDRRFTTYERPEERALQVRKRDGRLEPFSRDKLERGLGRAMEKRPIPEGALDALVDKIEREIREVHEIEVPAHFIGETAMLALRDLDHVAFVRFASVHKRFEEVEQFADVVEELRPLLGGPHEEDPE